jgi:predicted adenylyl cyclase CyaB
MVEIELKARINDPEEVKKRLSGLGTYDCAYEKDDAYWFIRETPERRGGKSVPRREAGGGPLPSLPPSGLRVRREINTAQDGGISKFNLITYKIRKLRAGIEINDEQEFEVSNGEVFEDLLRRLGLAPGIRKNKRGWAWRLDIPPADGPDTEIRAELSEVKPLGWFLELEILAPEKDEKIIDRCRERLFLFLEKLEIPREALETRPYTEMLKLLR